MSAARRNKSRSLELNVLISYCPERNDLVAELTSNNSGGVYSVKERVFEWGEISRLLPDFDSNAIFSPLEMNAKYVYHLDGLGSKRKREIEDLHGLADSSLVKGKADILVVDVNGRAKYLSVKDGSVPAKLGQKSAKTSYGIAVLEGGLGQLESQQVPSTINWTDTQLSEAQFQKISSAHRRLAYIKSHQREKWDGLVKSRMKDAIANLKDFGNTLKSDKSSLGAFVEDTLVGVTGISKQFFIVRNDEAYSVSDLLNLVQNSSLVVKDYNTDNKYSLILELILDDRTYGLTKIEPAFEGLAEKVSQTKGIIFHFQYYKNPTSGLGFADLLAEIGK